MLTSSQETNQQLHFANGKNCITSGLQLVPSATFELITPEYADILIKNNTNNRPVSGNTIKRYCQELVESNWIVNGDAIRIDVNGRLIDGQHRLLACIETKVSFKSFIIRNLPAEAFDTIDIGKPRTGADVLSMRGEISTRTLYAALNQVWQYKTRNAMHMNSLPKTQVVDFLEEHPGVRTAVNKFNNEGKGLLPQSILCAYHYLFTLVDERFADQFTQDLLAGENLVRTDPVYLLRERLFRYGAGSTRSSNQAQLHRCVKTALLIKTFNARFNNKSLKVLKWSQSEAFPDITHLPPELIV